MIVGIVLCAGANTRMGRPKAHLPWGGTTLLGRALDTLSAGGITHAVVAARMGDEVARRTVRAHGAALAWVDGPPADSPTGSLQAALATLRGAWAEPAIMVLPVDLPLIEPETVASLLAAYSAEPNGNARIYAPLYGEQRGHPTLFGAQHVAALAALDPAAWPRDVLTAAGDALRLVPVDDAGVITDIDDPESYARWRPG